MCENYYKHFSGRMVYTHGVKAMAQKHSAYWLIDAIASCQGDKRITGNAMLREIQFWTLTVENGRGKLVCVEDRKRPPVITQDIEWTDFPTDETRVWVERGSLDGVNEVMVAMLPEER
jgi:hypothetical protein